MSRARMIYCACFSHNTEIEQDSGERERSLSLIGAGACISRARAWAEPVGRGFIKAASDPVAERRARRRQISLACWRVHLRDDWRLDFWRWRRLRQRRVELRPARRNDDLRRSGAAED